MAKWDCQQKRILTLTVRSQLSLVECPSNNLHSNEENNGWKQSGSGHIYALQRPARLAKILQ